MAKLFFLAAYQLPLYARAGRSADERLAAIAAKARKESAYHLDHGALWTVRLGDGTDESHRRMQAAVDELWPYTHELFDRETRRRRSTRRRCAAGAATERRRAGAGRGDADPAGRRLGAGRRPGRRAHRAPGLPARRDAGAAPRPPGSDAGDRDVDARRGGRRGGRPGDPGAHHRRAGHPAGRSTATPTGRVDRHHHPDLHRLPGDGRDPGRHPPRAAPPPATPTSRSAPCYSPAVEHRLDHRGRPGQARRRRDRPARPRSPRRRPSCR